MSLDDVAARRLLTEWIDADGSICGPAFEWVVVNEQRVDASVLGGDGSQWHVVVHAAAGTERLESGAAFRRPDPPADAVSPLLVVANGPSGAGKSSLITALAHAQADVPWVVFDEPTFGSVAQPFLIWPDSAPSLHSGFLAGMAAVAAAGNRVAAAAAGHPQSAFRSVADRAGVRMLSIGVHAPREVLIERERGRDGRMGGLALRSLGAHDNWTYDLEVDSTTASPEVLAVRVLALL